MTGERTGPQTETEYRILVTQAEMDWMKRMLFAIRFEVPPSVADDIEKNVQPILNRAVPAGTVTAETRTAMTDTVPERGTR